MSTKKRSYSVSAPFKKPRVVSQPMLTGYNFKPTRYAATKGELKDATLTTTNRITVNTAAFGATLMNGVALGTTGSTRVGRRITMKSILLRWNMALAPTTAGSGAIRMVLVYDKQANAATPVATDVFDTDNFVAGMNLTNNRRFSVVADIVLEQGLSTTGPGANCGSRYIKLNHDVEFNTGSAGTVADIVTGSLILWVAQSGNLITAAPLSTIFSRVRFTDN